MLDTSSPDLPDSLRTLSRPTALRRAKNRRMRARRTAAIMVAFGIALAGVELLIVLSYL